MRHVDVLGGQVRVAGVVDLETTEAGIVLHRMSPWARRQHNSVDLAVLETMPAGGRLELETDATALELDVHLTLIQMGDAPAVPAVFDLVVNGELIDGRPATEGTRIVIDLATEGVDIVPGGPTTIRFALPPGHKR